MMKGKDCFVKRNSILTLGLVFSAACLSTYTDDSSAMEYGEFIVFPTVDIFSRTAVTDLDQKKTESKVDFFYTNDFGNQRLLAEALAEPEEDESQLDVERLQYGWILNHDVDIWVGRVHNPLGFWNTHFHHGSYLETSATRPSVIHFEDDDGILPMHITGVQVNRFNEIGDGGMHYSLGIGGGPDISDNKLEPVNILDPGKGSHELGGSLRVTYQTNDDDSSSQVGGTWSYYPIPAEGTSSGDIRQTILSLYGVLNIGSLHNLGSLFKVNNKFESADDDSFTSAYIQSEYLVQLDWTLYARVESTSGANHDTYLAIFPKTITQRQLCGVRYELMRNQALKIEVSSARTQNDNFNEFHVQWSAAIQ
jgi:hypothetical protein